MEKIKREIRLNDFYNNFGFPVPHIDPKGGYEIAKTFPCSQSNNRYSYDRIIDLSGNTIQAEECKWKAYLVNDTVFVSDGQKFTNRLSIDTFDHSEVSEYCDSTIFDILDGGAWKTFPRNIIIKNEVVSQSLINDIWDKIPLFDAIELEGRIANGINEPDNTIIYIETDDYEEIDASEDDGVYIINGIKYESDGKNWVRQRFDRYHVLSEVKSISFSSMVRIINLCSDIISSSRFYRACKRRGEKVLLEANKFRFKFGTIDEEIDIRNIFSCGLFIRCDEDSWIDVEEYGNKLWIDILNYFIWGRADFYQSGVELYDEESKFRGMYSSLDGAKEDLKYMEIGDFVWVNPYLDEMLNNFTTDHAQTNNESGETVPDTSYFFINEIDLESGKDTVMPKRYMTDESGNTEYSEYWKADRQSVYKAAIRMNLLIQFISDNIKLGNVESSIPVCPINVYLKESTSILGGLAPYEREWEKGRRYYEGDKCVYGGNEYRLEFPEDYDIYDITQIPDFELSAYFTVNDDGEFEPIEEFENFIKNIEGKWFIVRKYYYGLYDEINDDLLFDEIIESEDGSEEFKYWKLENTQCDSEDEYHIYGITESKLATLVRTRREYDDDGNELRYNLDYMENDGSKKFPSFRYLIKEPLNMRTEGDGYAFDFIDSIEVSYYGEEEYREATFNENGVAFFADCIDSGDTVEGVRITYYIGSSSDSSENLSEQIREGLCYNGVKYTDEYMASVISEYRTIYDNETNYEFIDINYASNIEENEENGLNVITSEIDLPDGSECNDDFITSECINENDIVGIIDEAFDFSDLYVDRGRYAAFERHNILGEVNTMDDLEKYRNDFFNLSKSN